jgi:hypothetical protein
VFILVFLSKNFKQFYSCRLDGDIAESVLPYPSVQKTFDDPTGIKTIINNDKHWGTNRFFSHYFLHKTLREVPLLLQKFSNSIDSIYYTSAIAKLVMQVLIILLLVIIINGNFKIFSLKSIFTAAILLPFFQINGGNLTHEIGIIGGSITYNFFYAMPLIFLLSYYIPVFFELLHNKRFKMNWLLIILWTIFAIISCFSSPTIPPVILIINMILFLYVFIKNWRVTENQTIFKKTFNALKLINLRTYLFLIPISFLALYSLFLGTFNSAYNDIQLSLKDMYMLLPKGILKSFFTSVSYLIFFFLLIINYLIVFLKYKNDTQYKKIVELYRFLIVFSAIYVLLLPLGGYRPYRPLILRCDTIIPITVLSIFTICYVFLFILKQLKTEKWNYYLKTVYPLCFFLIFAFFLGKNGVRIHNECEKSSLYTIANSNEDIVVLDNDCAVVGWTTFENPDDSKPYGELLYLWKITDRKKRWYNYQNKII